MKDFGYLCLLVYVRNLFLLLCLSRKLTLAGQICSVCSKKKTIARITNVRYHIYEGLEGAYIYFMFKSLTKWASEQESDIFLTGVFC